MLLVQVETLIMGFVNGVSAKAGELVNSVKNAVGNAIDAAKDLLGIASPRKYSNKSVFGQTKGSQLVSTKKLNAELTSLTMFWPAVVTALTALFQPLRIKFKMLSMAVDTDCLALFQPFEMLVPILLMEFETVDLILFQVFDKNCWILFQALDVAVVIVFQTLLN